ncbi:MAG: T9SS type A sorting domain-containing protein [Ignavibacteriaceae bacterium]|nr:T9SS type A sorting domain-containing protein [Ignavibacteriaceae bacterium]
MKKLLWSIVCFSFFLLSTQITFAQNQIPYSVIGGGGEKSSNESFILDGTVGEAFTGKSVSTANQQYSGFWYVYLHDVITSVENEEDIIPTVFKLEQNYPNPFNPSTIIKFGVPKRSNVLIKIYDILGSEVITIVNEEMDAGWYQKEFNAAGFASGVYIYRMTAGNPSSGSGQVYVSTKKMLMIK